MKSQMESLKLKKLNLTILNVKYDLGMYWGFLFSSDAQRIQSCGYLEYGVHIIVVSIERNWALCNCDIDDIHIIYFFHTSVTLLPKHGNSNLYVTYITCLQFYYKIVYISYIYPLVHLFQGDNDQQIYKFRYNWQIIQLS